MFCFCGYSTRPLRFGITLGGGGGARDGGGGGANSNANNSAAHDHNHNMQQKSDNNNKENGGGGAWTGKSQQRPAYLPIATNLPVATSCDYDSDSSDGPILYRDDDDDNLSEEGEEIIDP